MRAFIIVLLIASIGLIGTYLWNSTDTPEVVGSDTDTMNENTTAGMRAEENMVAVMEQRPGTSITGSLVYLAAPGFLVVHEDNNGAPGVILGASALLWTGESSQVQVALSRATRDGETLHAMLHSDSNNSGSFESSADMPVPSRLGGPISGWFEISSKASENVPISI